MQGLPEDDQKRMLAMIESMQTRDRWASSWSPRSSIAFVFLYLLRS